MTSITLIFVIVTTVVSIAAFNNASLFYRFQFNAYQITNRDEWYRFFTHALLHADWVHLMINMMVLFSFGGFVENRFYYYFGNDAIWYYLLLYVGAIPVSSWRSYYKNKDNYNYNAVGASGAVSAVVFSAIFFEPLAPLLLFAAIPIKAIIYGILYLIYSWYMSKRASDNIGHDAHFWGAIYGFVFPLIIEPNLFEIFIRKLLLF